MLYRATPRGTISVVYFEVIFHLYWLTADFNFIGRVIEKGDLFVEYVHIILEEIQEIQRF